MKTGSNQHLNCIWRDLTKQRNNICQTLFMFLDEGNEPSFLVGFVILATLSLGEIFDGRSQSSESGSKYKSELSQAKSSQGN
jgi:hypothetical protein